MKLSILPIAALILLVSCAPEGERNAIQYARKKIAEVAPQHVSSVEKITIQRTDTIFPLFALEMIGNDFIKACVADSPRTTIEKMHDEWNDIQLEAQFLAIYGSGSREHLKEFNEWRLCHRMDIHMKSNVTKHVDIIMDRDNTTPYMTVREYQEELGKLLESTTNAYFQYKENHLFDGI